MHAYSDESRETYIEINTRHDRYWLAICAVVCIVSLVAGGLIARPAQPGVRVIEAAGTVCVITQGNWFSSGDIDCDWYYLYLKRTK
jgi:hypothetical protein